MYDGKLVQAKHYFEMSTILLYYDFSQLSNNNKNTFSTNILHQTAPSPSKKSNIIS